jgi:hypothetical protein
MGCVRIMTNVNANNNASFQMCDDNIAHSDVKHTIPSEGVCYEYKYSEDDAYPSASTLTAACEGECVEKNQTIVCIVWNRLLSSPGIPLVTKHTSLSSLYNRSRIRVTL